MAGFNVNAARAQRLEALGRAWTFELDEDSFELPTELDRTVAHQLRALDDNDVDGLLRLLLGEQQFARFGRHAVTMQDIGAILEAYGKETGLGLGEDSASVSS
ncbi:hypothetical protein [Streptomyces beijiangensis]|uniref:Tail assembly chaperone n=1 Tax=Streptomyces beijiangensis TaxID=163361 RepID=A0A939JGF3_9ACTN|nr:hypothetical protein [Streptomyces beijiangensis]MBO0513363.1 hypothetical protein [Streptomyces beijiangensis]